MKDIDMQPVKMLVDLEGCMIPRFGNKKDEANDNFYDVQ